MSSPLNKRAYIALGGNQGNVLASFRFSLDAFGQAGMTIVQISSAYRTVALTASDGTESVPDYWNAVCEVETSQSARELLDSLLSVERDCGRVRSTKWESRPLDLDLLVYADSHITEEGLVVPHPRMRERAFVMRPLYEIAPELLLPPDGKSVGIANAELRSEDDGILEVRPFSL